MADTLSRACYEQISSDSTDDDLEIEAQVHLINSTLPISPEKYEKFVTETGKDSSLSQVMYLIQNGWPEEKQLLPGEVIEYWSVRDELSTSGGLVFRGERIVVPRVLRSDMLKLIHSSHLGVDKCRSRARDVLYWPGMNGQINDIVGKCGVCLTNKKSQPREPLKPHSIPERRWQKLATDLFELE